MVTTTLRSLALAAGALASIGSAVLATSADAADVRGCAPDRICLYDGKFWTGKWNSHPCETKDLQFDEAADYRKYFGGSPPSTSQYAFKYRVSSVLNRCPQSFRLVGRPRPGAPAYSTVIYSRQWVGDLGGWRRMDNNNLVMVRL